MIEETISAREKKEKLFPSSQITDIVMDNIKYGISQSLLRIFLTCQGFFFGFLDSMFIFNVNIILITILDGDMGFIGGRCTEFLWGV